MPVCKKCKGEKATREMSLWGGSVSDVCLECRAELKAARGNGGGVDTSKKRAHVVNTEKATETPATAELSLSVDAGAGFQAGVDGERLVVTQANSERPDADDNITLSKSEAFVLFAKFAEWAGLALTKVNS